MRNLRLADETETNRAALNDINRVKRKVQLTNDGELAEEKDFSSDPTIEIEQGNQRTS